MHERMRVSGSAARQHHLHQKAGFFQPLNKPALAQLGVMRLGGFHGGKIGFLTQHYLAISFVHLKCGHSRRGLAGSGTHAHERHRVDLGFTLLLALLAHVGG